MERVRPARFARRRRLCRAAPELLAGGFAPGRAELPLALMASCGCPGQEDEGLRPRDLRIRRGVRRGAVAERCPWARPGRAAAEL